MGAEVTGHGKKPSMQMDAHDFAPADAGGLKLSAQDRATLERLGADIEDLFDRAVVAKAKLELRGKRMGSMSRYIMKIARNDFAQANGVEIGVVEEIATGHKFQAAAARADVAAAQAAKLRVPGTTDPMKQLRADLAARTHQRLWVPITPAQRLAGLSRGRTTTALYRSSD